MAFGLLALFAANGHAAAAQFAADAGFVLMGVGHDGVWGQNGGGQIVAQVCGCGGMVDAFRWPLGVGNEVGRCVNARGS